MIEAPPEQMERALHPKGIRVDNDKEIEEMNDEEKATFAALNAADDEYEELEDDFIFLANEGQVAIEAIEEDGAGAEKNAKKPADQAEAEYRNRDIMILKENDDPDDPEVQLREYRLKMAALLPPEGANFAGVFAGQAELDAGFDAFMDEEYDEDKIGELMEEEVEAQDKIERRVLDEAVDEFIDGTKRRFLDLAKEFGGEKQRNLMPAEKASEQIHAEDLEDGDEPEEVKQKIRQRKIELADAFEEEALEHLDDDVTRDKSDDEEQWDAETILTTYTNTDNHPGVIKTTRRVRPKAKIELHKQFRVPVDGLIPLAEEIVVAKEKKATASMPFTKVDEAAEEDGD